MVLMHAPRISIKPRRGGIFIERTPIRPIPFCFSAAQRSQEFQAWIADRKRNHFGACRCYKYATPTGLGTERDSSKPHTTRSKMWVMTRIEVRAPAFISFYPQSDRKRIFQTAPNRSRQATRH